MLTVTILEAIQISPPDDILHLPVIIYPTATATAASIMYHTACFLLLTHKPRLCVVAEDDSEASFTKHVQSIAGVASSNDHPGQWDPVVVAALFRSARKLTHESQHGAVLRVLDKVTATTGLNLAREKRELEEMRTASQYGE
jgi:hypothetical protein